MGKIKVKTEGLWDGTIDFIEDGLHTHHFKSTDVHGKPTFNAYAVIAAAPGNMFRLQVGEMTMTVEGVESEEPPKRSVMKIFRDAFAKIFR